MDLKILEDFLNTLPKEEKEGFFNQPETYTDPETGITINLVNYFKQIQYYTLSRVVALVLYKINNENNICRCKTLEKEISDKITNATTVREVNNINIFQIFENEGLL